MNVSFFIFFIYPWNFRWMRATVKISVGQNSVNLSSRDLAESRETCTMWFYIHLHYVLHHPLLSVLSRLSCACARGVQVHSPRSCPPLTHSYLSIILRMTVIIREFPFFKREISPKMTFPFIMQIISWKDMRGQLPSSQFALCHVSCKSNQAIFHLFLLRFFE